MKKILFPILLLIFLSAILGGIYYITQSSTPISADIKDFLLIKPKQYIGATVDMSQILPESVHYIKNSQGQDLIDIASSLGMNTLRITNITSIGSKVIPSYTNAQWAEVLNKMKSKNMYAVILVEANAQDTKFDRVHLNDYYLNFVQNYVVTPEACGFSNVLAIDIANEPLLNASNLAKLKDAANMIKTACPNAKITIGSWSTDSGQKDSSGKPIYFWHDPKEVRQIENIVDIDSVHIYGFDKKLDNGSYPDPYTLTTGYLKEVRKYTNKPIFIEEFGAGNGTSVTDQNTLGSQNLQKNAYDGVLRAIFDFRNRGVLGGTAYVLSSRNDKPDGWSMSLDRASILLPAAYSFKQYSNN